LANIVYYAQRPVGCPGYCPEARGGYGRLGNTAAFGKEERFQKGEFHENGGQGFAGNLYFFYCFQRV